MYRCQIVICNATMISSFSTSAVNEIETMFRNSVSKRRRDMIIIAAPERGCFVGNMKGRGERTYLDKDLSCTIRRKSCMITTDPVVPDRVSQDHPFQHAKYTPWSTPYTT